MRGAGRYRHLRMGEGAGGGGGGGAVTRSKVQGGLEY